MVAPPVKDSAPVRIVVPAPMCVNPPVPLMSFATVTSPLRLKISVPSLITAPVPSVPAVLPLPTCNVPALIVVVPP